MRPVEEVVNLTIDSFQNEVSADMAIRTDEYRYSLQLQR